MTHERGGSDPFAAELEAVFVSGGNLSRIDAHEAVSGQVLVPRLQQLEPGDTLYLSQDSGESLDAYNHAHVTRMDNLSKTRTNAYSGIFFGQLSLTGDSGEENTQMVAVKPLDRDWLAAQEFKMAHTINTIGLHRAETVSNPMTFKPVAFHRLSDGRMSVITAYEQQVKSFDNTLWVPPEYRPNESTIRWALGNAAATLVFLHAHALVHTDYQVKNTAVDPNGPRIIDITSMRRVGGIGRNAAEAYLGDVKAYIGSLNLIAREHSTTYVTEDQVRGYLVEPYAARTGEVFDRRGGVKAMIDYRLTTSDLTAEL